jgi:hypothetical protein
MYANTDHDQPCEVDKQVRWFTNTSFNNGIDWSASHEIYNSTNVDWCAFGDTANAKIRDFGFVRDPTGFYWAAVHDSVESIRVFVSEDIGFTWRQVHQVSFFPTRSLFHPTLGADASGRILLSYYASDANDAQIQRMVIAGAGRADPEGWSLNVPASPFFPPSTGFGETIFLGDYDDVTAVDPATYPGANGTFAISWADSTRIPGFEVAAAYVSVPSP